MIPLPTTKVARHATIQMLLEDEEISSQAQLRERLKANGIDVTQATLSRDLLELRATKVRTPSGRQVYSLSNGEIGENQGYDGRLARWCQEVLLKVDHAMNQVVLRTPPGAAQMLAAAIDQGQLEGVIGTIAGDDTILLICQDADTAEKTSKWLVDLVNQT